MLKFERRISDRRGRPEYHCYCSPGEILIRSLPAKRRIPLLRATRSPSYRKFYPGITFFSFFFQNMNFIRKTLIKIAQSYYGIRKLIHNIIAAGYTRRVVRGRTLNVPLKRAVHPGVFFFFFFCAYVKRVFVFFFF